MGNLTTSKAITFIDVETTDLDPAKSTILSISIITDWDNGTQDVWSTKIKPKPIEIRFASNDALKICNYSEEEWISAPNFEEVAETIAKKVRWGPLVGHNIQFDLAHIAAVFKRYGWKQCNTKIMSDPQSTDKLYRFGYPAIDTCALAYIFLPTERQNLNALREHYNISLDRAHNAITDAEDCRTVFYNIIAGLGNEN